MANNQESSNPESYLSLRQPSNEEDQRFISGLNSSYEAAKLRSTSSDRSAKDFHSPVKFSWKDFWKTFIYENLPPVFLSPLAAIIMESSLKNAKLCLASLGGWGGIFHQ